MGAFLQIVGGMGLMLLGVVSGLVGRNNKNGFHFIPEDSQEEAVVSPGLSILSMLIGTLLFFSGVLSGLLHLTSKE